MSASRSSAVWWDYRRGLFPRPFTIYAGNVEDVSLGASDFARALTNAERRNQRRGDGARRGGGTGQDSAGQPWRARTERRTETGSSSKDYADAQGDAVNQRAPKSVEGKELAPQVGLEPTTLRLTAECSTIELLRSNELTSLEQTDCRVSNTTRVSCRFSCKMSLGGTGRATGIGARGAAKRLEACVFQPALRIRAATPASAGRACGRASFRRRHRCGCCPESRRSRESTTAPSPS